MIQRSKYKSASRRPNQACLSEICKILTRQTPDIKQLLQQIAGPEFDTVTNSSCSRSSGSSLICVTG